MPKLELSKDKMAMLVGVAREQMVEAAVLKKRANLIELQSTDPSFWKKRAQDFASFEGELKKLDRVFTEGLSTGSIKLSEEEMKFVLDLLDREVYLWFWRGEQVRLLHTDLYNLGIKEKEALPFWKKQIDYVSGVGYSLEDLRREIEKLHKEEHIT